MKKLIPLLALLALAATTNAPKLSWDYPTNQVSDDLVFLLYQSTNVQTPMSNWPVVYSVSATNTNSFTTVGATNVYSAPLTNVPGQWFFFCTASNLWGESDPSNVADTPPQAQKRVLRIGL